MDIPTGDTNNDRVLTRRLVAALVVVVAGLVLSVISVSTSAGAFEEHRSDLHRHVGDGFVVTRYLAGEQRPLRWDPCAPIYLVVNDTEMPAAAAGAFEEIIAELSELTGLSLVVLGRTDETAAGGRDRVDGQPPVLVEWSHEDANEELAGTVLGYTVVRSAVVDQTWWRVGVRRYVTGVVVLDAEQIATYNDVADMARAVIRHELGHLLGLDHVDDPEELMYSHMSGRSSYGPGDKRGLAELGGTCT